MWVLWEQWGILEYILTASDSVTGLRVVDEKQCQIICKIIKVILSEKFDGLCFCRSHGAIVRAHFRRIICIVHLYAAITTFFSLWEKLIYYCKTTMFCYSSNSHKIWSYTLDHDICSQGAFFLHPLLPFVLNIAYTKKNWINEKNNKIKIKRERKSKSLLLPHLVAFI